MNAETIRKPSWQEWLKTSALRPDQPIRTQGVSLRFQANGFDWDVHGTLTTPVGALQAQKFVLTHGGAGSETEVLETPDGRPGLAMVLAQQGYETLSISYPGHYPEGGVWTQSVAERTPLYLLDRALPADEIAFRNLVCTFDVHVRAMALLVDHVFDGTEIVAFGHSTGGPMAVSLQEHLTRNEVIGIVGWGSAEPTVWGREWDLWVNGAPRPRLPIHHMAWRTASWFESAGYVDPPDLSPWGGAAEYTAWADRHKSQFKTSLCENQLFGHIDILYEYAELTKLPIERYIDYLHDPDPQWLSRTGVFLMVGENDSRLCTGNHPSGLQRYAYGAFKYADRARAAKAVVVPRLGHFGFVALHNEKIAYAWIKALESGFFAQPSQRPKAPVAPAAA